MRSTIAQIIAISIFNLRELRGRLGASLVILVGIAGMTAVLLSILGMAVGFDRAMSNSGQKDRVILLSKGSTMELTSSITRSQVRDIEQVRGVRRDSDGEMALISPELMSQIAVKERSTGVEVSATLRGLEPVGLHVWPEMKVVEGRMFAPGMNELIVGTMAKKQFRNTEIGTIMSIYGANWKIVGIFESNGSARESEFIGDAATLMSARGGQYQSVAVKLNSPESFQAFVQSIQSNPTLALESYRESDFLLRQSAGFHHLISTVIYIVGSVMALGAWFAAMNSMYAAVYSRRREMATLRAIGFSSRVVVCAFVVESSILSMLGGIVGVSIAALALDGSAVATGIGGGGAARQVIFDLSVSWSLIGIGLAGALCIGALGGMVPAIQKSRAPIAAALRAS